MDAPQPKAKSYWPLGIIVGLGVVVAANAVMITIAHQHKPIVEDSNAYQKGLNFEEELVIARASASLKWTALFDTDHGDLRLRLVGPDGQPIAGLKGQLRLTRGDTRSQDAELTLHASQSGEYRARWNGTPGLYRLRTRLEGGTHPWVDDRQQTLP